MFAIYATAAFQFASLQSEIGKHLTSHYQIPEHIDSLILIHNERVYLQSSAVLHICGQLPGMWKLLKIGMLIPSFLRNRIYHFIAARRYRWFGEKDVCMIPTPEMKKRFLHDNEE